MINELLNISVESAGQPKIKTPDFEMLSQLHLLICMPFATGKSSLAHSIKASNIPVSNISLNYTLPSLVGTISKDGDFIESSLIESANGIFMIDEGHRLSKKCVDAILSLLEQGYYSRSLGFKCKQINDVGDYWKEGYSVTGHKNLSGFNIWVRFSCIWFGERLYKYHKFAFLSRFFPILINPSKEDIKRYMMGENPFAFKLKRKFKIYKKETKINKKMFYYLTEEFWKLTEDIEFDDDCEGFRVRGRGQIIKIAGSLARQRGSLNVNKKDCDKALKYANICMNNYNVSQMTQLEFHIYEKLLDGMKQCDIARDLEISRQTVSEYVHKLKTKYKFKFKNE